jgi:glutamyl-tRNA(Gln) amidotransferase subunit E
MYPETDIPPVQITEDLVKKIGSDLPEFPEQKLQRLMKQYGLNQKLAKQILDSQNTELFEIIVKESNVAPTTVAAFMTETLKALKRDGVQVDRISDHQIREIFKAAGHGKLAKEAVPGIFTWLSEHEEKTVEEAISSMGLNMLPEGELERVVDDAIAASKDLIKERGTNAFGPIVGIVMKKVRGRADAASVSDLVKKKLARKEKK